MKNISKKKKIYNVKTRKNTKRTGGKAIDAGSYGCVFKPAIKCANPAPFPYSDKTISKLMYKEDTESELAEMEKVKNIIQNIPNKENYFLISNTYDCSPDKLSQEDLYKFDRKCNLFTKRGINSMNINESKNMKELALIVMPNGGLNVEKYLLKLFDISEKERHKKFIVLNNALIKLLVNGIVPLNNMKFNHYDIKAGNILISSEDNHARLIDWGLSGENDGLHIPETIKNRSIAFNMPFSDIFFNKFIRKWLPEELNLIKASNKFNNKISGQSELLKVVAVNVINKSIQQTSEGHFEYITNTILHDIYQIYAMDNTYNRVDYNVLSYTTLIEYIHEVLLKYVDVYGNFNDTNYFYDVFSKNVDIWGFLLSYIPIIEFGVSKFHKDIINGICRILLKYCFSAEFAAKAINVNELTMELQSLNTIADEIIMNKSISPPKPLSSPKPFAPLEPEPLLATPEPFAASLKKLSHKKVPSLVKKLSNKRMPDLVPNNQSEQIVLNYSE